MNAETSATAPSPTVLIVADDASNLRLAVDYLEQDGMTVAIARNGQEGLERARYLRPDLILLDVLLPGIDGFDTCRQLKSDAATREIPVIFMTALADMNDKVTAFAVGGVDYVAKPFQLEELLARVRTHLALNAAQRELIERNKQLQTTLASIAQGVCLFDARGRLVLSNARYAEVYGLESTSVHPGMTLDEVLKLRYAVGARADISTQEYLAWATEQNASDGPKEWVLELNSGKVIRGHHQRTGDGGWVSTHEDITQAWQARKALNEAREQAERAEQEARAAHARLLDAFEVVPEGLALFDSEDRYVLWNRRYEQIYAESGDKIAKGMRFEDTLRAGLEVGQYAEAVGREHEWLTERLARHAQAKSTHEQRLAGNRWLRIEERRTSDGGSVGIRIDITDLKRREASFRLLFDNNPVPMWVYDRETLNFLAVNQAAIDHYGYSCEEFLSMSLLNIRPTGDWDAVKTLITASDGQDGNRSWRHRKADGSEIEVLIYSRRLTYEERQASLIAVVDITERKRAEDDLRTTREFLDTVIESVPATIFVKDAIEQRYVLVNKAGEDLLGLPRSELVGKTVHEIMPAAIAEQIAARDEELLSCGGSETIVGEVFDTQSKGPRTVNSSAVTIAGKDGSPRYLLRVVEDMTERIEAERRAAHLALHDPLTDLPNRAALMEKLAGLLDAGSANTRPFALLCLDLDHFKEVNDVFGHNAGDAFLCAISRRLEMTAEGAFVARLGGDEFILLAEGDEQPGSSVALAERILAAFTAELEIDAQRTRAGMSIGVAIFPSDGTDATTLMASADAALYRAKAAGRGTVRFFEPEMDRHLREKRALQRDLHAALADGQLRVHYQPQALINGEIVGFEALLRWHHPARGDIPPSTFVPIAEESSLICDIGAWILREACREAASWPRDLHIAVNLSPVQFKHGDLPRMVHTILLETGLAPNRLELEITESVLIDNSSRALSILRGLKALGVRVAMDDFGTGYSSLSYLQSFPFDKIKIDQSFVANVAHPQSAAIVRAVIGLGRGLQLPVVAEGVETSHQLDFLADESCDQVQGYLIGRPRPIEEYAQHTGHDDPLARRRSVRK
jgi:diguanylate cyclase (GGDEF)-like protein/PAS domain S-box-containing protein